MLATQHDCPLGSRTSFTVEIDPESESEGDTFSDIEAIVERSRILRRKDEEAVEG